jgi:nitrilase
VESFKIAVVQAAPVALDRDATIEKACGLIAEAAAQRARLVLFPEAFVPTYPDWVWAIPPGESSVLGELYAELVAQAVSVPSPATDRLCQAAQDAGVYVVMGINERNGEASNASLYNTLLYIDPAGALMGKHRKLTPTAAERLVWSQGDGSTLQVYETELGKVGGLICWENYMPLARYALYAWGVQLYLAPTWDRGENWLATLRHIATEGRVYVAGCCMALHKRDLPERLRAFYSSDDGWINRGDSAIVGPNGELLAGPLQEQEGILTAEVNPAQLRGAKWMFDVAGHYARPDVFQLVIHQEPRPQIVTAGVGGGV